MMRTPGIIALFMLFMFALPATVEGQQGKLRKSDNAVAARKTEHGVQAGGAIARVVRQIAVGRKLTAASQSKRLRTNRTLRPRE